MNNNDQIDQQLQQIHDYLAAQNVDFEGKPIRVSAQPLIVPASTVESTSKKLGKVCWVLEKLLDKLHFEIRLGSDSPLKAMMSPYEKWFGLIAAERRSSKQIMLMRYDTVLHQISGEHQWMAMEPNTACPGGVIHCAYIRDAWLNTDQGKALTMSETLKEYAIDSVDGFLLLLEKTVRKTNNPTVALCNYRGLYSNELASIKNRAEQRRSEGLSNLNVVIGDIRDLKSNRGVIELNGQPVQLIHNKVDQIQIACEAFPDDNIEGWLAASASDDCEFVNSLAALYLGESKMIFAALHDPEIQNFYPEIFSAENIASINDCVLGTYVISDKLEKSIRKDAWLNKDAWVIKGDGGTRGESVFLGMDTPMEDWADLLLITDGEPKVLQRAIDTPSREMVAGKRREYFGLDWFFLNGEFGGCVSRAHTNRVFNVGNGGCEVPTLISLDETQ